MTEKRFTYEYDEYNGNLFDNKMNTFYPIEDSDENIEVLCDRLNWLVEENEQLKQFKEQVFQLIDEKNKEMKEHMENEALMESPSYYSGLMFGIEVLEELKKELQE